VCSSDLKASDYLPKVEHAMKARNLPYGCSREKIAISLSSTEYHDFVSCPMNADYTAFFGYVIQGNDLSVNWLLQDHMIKGVYRLPFIGPLLLSVMKRYTFAMGNKVRAFAGATHACAVEAAEAILDEASADKSKLNRKTSGQLGPL